MTENAQAVAQVAENYYDSEDADNFYREIWGGEDIHIGLYGDGDDIRTASHKTVLRMLSKLRDLSGDSNVLDIGAGYGGAARVIARESGAHVTCLNLSKVENDRNEMLNKQQGLDDLVDVVHGSFEDIPMADNSVDVVWSQDAILHSGDRELVLREVDRVLKPGGEFIFTDPMQADEIDDPSVLQPVYDRIHLNNLGSIRFYKDELAKLGFEVVEVDDLSPQLTNHYSNVAAALEAARDKLDGKVSPDYVDRMLAGLSHWINGGKNGYLKWGILHFRKS